jgi:hypothetical protein
VAGPVVLQGLPEGFGNRRHRILCFVLG